MAPQNSTLLHESAAELTSELGRYSPIFTAYNNGKEDSDYSSTGTSDTVQRKKSIGTSSKTINNIQAEDEVPIWICGEPRFISGVTSTTTCNELIQALIDDELNSNSTDVAASRDLNDYVITEKWRDVEQALPGDTNILPIWVAWGSARQEVKFKLKINKNKAGTKIVDDYGNNDGDVSYGDDGDDYDDDKQQQKQVKRMKRKKISALTHMLRRLIHQGENIKQQLATISEKRAIDHSHASKSNRSKLAKNYLMQSFLCDTTRPICDPTEAVKQSFSSSDTDFSGYNRMIRSTNPYMHEPMINGTATTDDELFLIIDDGVCGVNNENDSNVHVEYRQYYLNKKLNLAIAAKNNDGNQAKVHCIEATPKRKSISRKLEFDALRQNSFNKRLIKYLCTQARVNQQCSQTKNVGSNAIEREIEQRMIEMYELIAYEEELMKQLSTKCERYRNQNNKYMTTLRLELCIDEVQQSLDAYAKEIIQNELELYQIKSEIHQKCGILYNLQRMVSSDLRSSNKNENQMVLALRKSRLPLFDSDFDAYDGFCDASNDKSLII